MADNGRDSFVEDNEDELKSLASAVGESDAGKMAGAAAALATKILTGSSIAAGGVESAVSGAFGRWFADNPDARLSAVAKGFAREDNQRAALERFALIVKPVLEAVQRSTEGQLQALLQGQERAASTSGLVAGELESSVWQVLEQLARLQAGQEEFKAALERVSRQRARTEDIRDTAQPLHLRFFVSSPAVTEPCRSWKSARSRASSLMAATPGAT